ncbi:MAG: SDR family NAD(P)-dependent oxidoreductase [Nostoc sp.]|uniref:SDR family NAD(P)-dependent oxidoreductase n=1 Tax=Nostoc sp. TaxID=1180 RepID=UPI002FF08EC6
MAKTAIVTGASRGIGREIAKRLAADGFSTVITYSESAAKADEAVSEIKAAGGNAITVKANVSKENEVEQLFEHTIGTLGQIDVVVHSAGIMPLSPIIKNDVQQFDSVIATNLRGTFLVLAQAAEHITDGGRIIALSSSVVAKSFPGYGAYIASKAGVEGLVRVLANELRGRNVTVNAVAPGPVATELFLQDKTQEQIEQLSPIGTSWRTPRHCACSFIPGRTRRGLGQRSSSSRQRRFCLIHI